MDHDPLAWPQALRRVHDRLVAFAATATAGDLRRTSMSTEWSVAQVLSHLGSGAEIGYANVTGAPIDPRPVWDRWDGLDPEGKAAAFAPADERLVAWYESLDAEAMRSVQVNLPFLPEPVDAVGAAGFRLSEAALHSWDVFAAFEPDEGLEPGATELLLDRLPSMVGLLARFLPRESRPAATTTLAVTTTDPARTYELELGDGMELRPPGAGAADGGAADGTLELPGETLVRLVAGRLRPPDDARVVVAGPLGIDDLRRAFPGF